MKKKNKIIILIFNLFLIGFIFYSINLFIKNKIDIFIPYIRNHYEIPIHDNLQFDIKNYETEKTTVKQLEFNANSFNKFCGEERTRFGENYSKNPIIVLGCSYAYGHGLKKEDTFSYKLSNITKRPIYNFSGCGGDALVSFDQIHNDDYKNINNTEYVIYIYMHDHINRYLLIERLYRNYENLFLDNEDNSLPNKIKKYIIKFPIFKLIMTYYKERKILKAPDILSPSNLENSSNFLKLIMKFLYKKIKINYPNAKFIIILYDQKIADMYNPVNIKFEWEMQKSKIWDELAQETNGDIIIVRTEDIVGFYFDKNYKLKEDISDWHPNAKVWTVFTPKFAKKYIN